ncbi:MAG: 50S ribosomal protein L25/general stress protein Ctc [Legionellaceae bacterium]|nr:50S ribosomal protein L25/general stress protein Ctc [Legionellaceae bacterium]
MSNMVLEATERTDTGKGASRRLRRLENQVPAIIYGGDKESVNIMFPHNKVVKALENEAIYSSVFDIKLGSTKEQVILKDLQRHPYKPIIMHMDLQRVSAKDMLVKTVPLHFVNEESCKGVKAGGIINRVMNQIEIRCQARNLPEFIEVDLLNLEKDATIHLSEIQLPKGVTLATEIQDKDHDHPVVAVHAPQREAAATDDGAEASDAG